MSLAAKEVQEEPRTISRFTFWVLVFLAVLLVTIMEALVAVVVQRALGRHLIGGWLIGLSMLNLYLAILAVDRVLRRMGLSRSGKTREVRERSVALPEGEVADDATVEVRIPASLLTGMAVLYLVSALVLTVLLVGIPAARPKAPWAGYVTIGASALGGLYFLLERLWGKPQAWADESGISATPMGFHAKARFVPWSEVATCEIETYHNTLGEPVVSRWTLRGIDGRTLLIPNLNYTAPKDQERLLQFIRAKLPKKPVDPMEW